MDNFENLNNDFLLNELDKPAQKVIIKVQQRNGRKNWTIVENFAYNLDKDEIKNFIKLVKKKQCCNGSYQKKEKVIQFQGNHIIFIKQLLINNYEYKEDEIIIKG